VIDGEVVVVDVAPPVDGVTVRVRSAGICGSDLHMIEHGVAPAVTIGHEISGHTADGTPVAIEPVIGCGECEQCSMGAYGRCSGPARLLGTGDDGGMADLMGVPERSLVPLDRSIPIGDASLVEPLAVAVHGLHLAGHHQDDRVAIVGGGAIGLTALAAVRAAGSRAWLAARHDAQWNAAARLGSEGAPVGSYDLVIETAGTESAQADAVALARPGGRVLMLSIHWRPTMSPGIGLWLNEISVSHSMMYCAATGSRDIDTAAAILAADSAIGESLITHRFSLDSAADAFAVANDRASGAIKVVLEP
jgi:L-iditol 2-dehydrogenase